MPAGVCLALPTGPQCFQAEPASLIIGMDKHLPDLLVDTSLASYQNCLVFSHGIVMRESSGVLQGPKDTTTTGSSEGRFLTIGTNGGSVEVSEGKHHRQYSSNSGDSGFEEDSSYPNSDNKMGDSMRTVASNDNITLQGQRSHIRIITPSVGSTQDTMSGSSTMNRQPLVPTFDWTPSKHLVVKLPPVAPRQQCPQTQVPFSQTVQSNPFRVSPQLLDTNPFKTLEDGESLDTNPFRHTHSPTSLPTTNPFLDTSISAAVSITNPFIVPDSTFAVESDTQRELNPSPVMIKRLSPNCQWDLDTLATATHHLEMSGFYYPSMTMQEAKIKLRDSPEGTFLVRDSSQPNYLFSISAKTCRGTTSVRVEYSKGRFKLDTEGPSKTHFPSFDCIIKLLQFYVKVSTEGKGRSCVYAETSGRRDTPVVFQTPLRHTVSSLGHLARRTINKCVARGNIDDLPIQRGYVESLLEYPFWL